MSFLTNWRKRRLAEKIAREACEKVADLWGFSASPCRSGVTGNKYRRDRRPTGLEAVARVACRTYSGGVGSSPTRG